MPYLYGREMTNCVLLHYAHHVYAGVGARHFEKLDAFDCREFVVGKLGTVQPQGTPIADRIL